MCCLHLSRQIVCAGADRVCTCSVRKQQLVYLFLTCMQQNACFLVLNDEQCFGGLQSVYSLMEIHNNNKLGKSDVRWLAKNQIAKLGTAQCITPLYYSYYTNIGSCVTMEFGISKRLYDDLALS